MRETLFNVRKLGGALALTACCLVAVGCGSSSSTTTDGPAEKFLGRWEIDSPTSTFSINCPATMLSGSALVWGELDFEHGVLTDVTESSATCLGGVSFSVENTTTIALVNPDPYTQQASFCDLVLGNDAAGSPIILELNFSSLTFQLLAVTKGMAPTGLLAGMATGAVFQTDATTGQPAQTDTCTYSGAGDTYHQMTRP